MDPRDSTGGASARPDPESRGAADRLDSWKDVAAYLKRDVSTVQRWERREGLPIHRLQHDKLGSVFAFRHELDAWRDARSRRGDQAKPVLDESLTPPLPETYASPIDPSEPAEGSVQVTAPPATSRPNRRLPVAAVVVLGLAALGALAWLVSSRSPSSSGPPPADARVTRLTDQRGLEEAPAISPDGRSVAFSAGVSGTRQVFVQLVTGGTPLQLTREAIDHDHPRWLPDSSGLVYFSPGGLGEPQGHLWGVDALGGGPRRITASMGGADVSAIDGRLAFFRLDGPEIHLVAAPPDGSRGQVVARFPPTTYYLSPRWSPDGRWIAFQRGDSIRFDLFVVPAAGGEARQLTHDNTMMSGLAWRPDSTGLVVSSSRGGTMPYLPTMSLWSVAIDETGRMQQLTSGESSYTSPDISKTGAVFVSRMRQQSDLWKFPTEGTPADNVERAVRLTSQTGQVLTPTVSPDDREIAYLSDSGGHANLWVANVEGGDARRLTDERDPAVAVGVPVWSPTDRTIAFVYSRGNQGLTFGVWSIGADGSNLRSVANPGLGPAWSHDGRWLYYSTRGGNQPADIVLEKIPAEGGIPVTVTSERLRNVIGSDGSTLYYTFERPLVDGVPEFEIRAASPEDAPFRVLARIPATRVPTWQIVNPALSRDGRWLAQALTDGFTTNIWALSTSDGGWRQLTDFGERATFIARRVSWSSDGRFVFAAVADGDADIVRLDGLPTGPASGEGR